MERIDPNIKWLETENQELRRLLRDASRELQTLRDQLDTDPFGRTSRPRSGNLPAEAGR